MAKHDLTPQFQEAQRRVNLGTRQKVAEAAHLDVRGVLRESPVLTQHGLADVLIGSYARDLGIWPGKDVDVFGKLTNETIESITPAAAYEMFQIVLVKAYPDRVTLQPRSIKISFGPSARPAERYLVEKSVRTADVASLDFEFWIDVVPAVRWGDGNWGIPQRNPEFWKRAVAQERWRKTNPEALTGLTATRNADLLVGGQGAFVPTVKAMKQFKRHHLKDIGPSALFYEFMLHEGFELARVSGESWADVTASALDDIADRLTTAATKPVLDPALNEPYRPAPNAADISRAVHTIRSRANQAIEALSAEKCPAAANWRTVLGANGNEGHDSVFPLPDGCRSDGTAMAVTAAVNPLRGGSRERSFGGQ